MKTTFEPEYIPSDGDIANLSSMVAMPGFQVLNRLMRSECDKLIMALINADPGSSDEILAKHGIARAASVFYDGIINTINECIDIHRSASREKDSKINPIDPTEGLIDIGDKWPDEDGF